VRHVTPERNKNAFGHASRAASCAEVASLRAETIASQTNRSGKATARNPAFGNGAYLFHVDRSTDVGGVSEKNVSDRLSPSATRCPYFAPARMP
jgi:hypothetical protein